MIPLKIIYITPIKMSLPPFFLSLPSPLTFP